MMSLLMTQVRPLDTSHHSPNKDSEGHAGVTPPFTGVSERCHVKTHATPPPPTVGFEPERPPLVDPPLGCGVPTNDDCSVVSSTFAETGNRGERENEFAQQDTSSSTKTMMVRRQQLENRTQSSSSDLSTQSTPTARRRVIFPTLYHQSSWPEAASPSLADMKKVSLAVSSTNHNSMETEGVSTASDAATSSSGTAAASIRKDIIGSTLPPQTEQQQQKPQTTTTRGLQGQRLVMPPPPAKKHSSGSCCSSSGNSNISGAEGRGNLVSILRSSSRSSSSLGGSSSSGAHGVCSPPHKKIVVDKIPSVESDIPSLASTVSQSSIEDIVTQSIPSKVYDARARSSSLPVTKADEKKISFDPRVWVREFHRAPSEEKVTWYTSKDLEIFKADAIKLILESSETELVPTGTGRFVPRRVVPKSKAFFSHRALRLDAGEDESSSGVPPCRNPKNNSKVGRIAPLPAPTRQEGEKIHRILIVDPHDICIKLFAKGFKHIFPHVEVVGTGSSEEAVEKMKSSKFDVVLVEERLKLFHQQHSNPSLASGAALIQALKQCQPKGHCALFIGVSTRLKEDAPKLQAGGADFCWPKPPPKLDNSVAQDLLCALSRKRGQKESF